MIVGQTMLWDKQTDIRLIILYKCTLIPSDTVGGGMHIYDTEI